jgi:hypothetical protein
MAWARKLGEACRTRLSRHNKWKGFLVEWWNVQWCKVPSIDTSIFCVRELLWNAKNKTLECFTWGGFDFSQAWELEALGLKHHSLNLHCLHNLALLRFNWKGFRCVWIIEPPQEVPYTTPRQAFSSFVLLHVPNKHNTLVTFWQPWHKLHYLHKCWNFQRKKIVMENKESVGIFNLKIWTHQI